ncbi:MotA/TolQ/ExbB proton channel family protein [Shewanella carassii]|uniref:MotA/TolQ/ExbB proton channel domain-containing protein n=1 Tax=Shewanella carassii TaxID=1987584 RepID=A0ABQ1T5I3_9GAMM|nr:MotA/TolQ/ExbB proton channel family protein [Shewanella carassii]GGE84197.1 hypothetical protein GCM10011520_25820 [Shewanella carassii]
MSDALHQYLPDWVLGGGPILVFILFFAVVLYWQLADLLLQLKCVGGKSCWQCCNHKCVQLLAWVSAAPLLGLLGTVDGLLGSFEAMTQGHGEAITRGMAQALLTTEVGLAVAIPAWLLLLLGQQHCQSQLEQQI